jgi:hypothetical protein
MTNPDDTRIDERLWHAEQSWNYRAIHRVPRAGERHLMVRVDIRRNAYDGQSYLRAEVFGDTDLKWNVVDSLPMDKGRACYKVVYVHDTADIKLFRKDEAELLQMAVAILPVAA